MLSVAEIRNVKFTKAMGGYKQEEVDVLLDRIEADYTQFERAFKEYKAKIDSMNKEIETLKSSQNSIQNVLLSAQKLADQIVDEAKQKSEEIIDNAQSNIEVMTAREKELATAFELKAQERKNNLQKELDEHQKAHKAVNDRRDAREQIDERIEERARLCARRTGEEHRRSEPDKGREQHRDERNVERAHNEVENAGRGARSRIVNGHPALAEEEVLHRYFFKRRQRLLHDKIDDKRQHEHCQDRERIQQRGKRRVFGPAHRQDLPSQRCLLSR